MKTILAVIRVSTERQEIESQHNSMLDFLTEKGLPYTEENIQWLEVKGASARSVNKEYLQMLDTIKNTITNNPTINAVAFWHLNRLGRWEKYIVDMKTWFINNHIQVYVKTPNLTLLKEDGTLDNGANIAWGVFASMVSYDTMEQFDKMQRGKKQNASVGKFNGGQKVKYGYTLDANNYYVVNEESAAQIKMLFEMYASKKYSIRKLCEELNERGITRTDGVAYRVTFLQALLKDYCYTGEPNKKFLNRVYPKIISKELFEKCKKVLKENNTTQIKQNKLIHLGSMIWKCPECGYYLTSCVGYYKCNHHYNKFAYTIDENRCGMSNTFCEKYVDLMLWEVAFEKHIDFLLKDSDVSKKETEEQIKILKEKVNTLNKKISDIDTRKKALSDLYIDGTYTKEEFTVRKNKLDNSVKENKELVIKYTEDIERLNKILNTPKENYKLFYKNILSTVNKPTKEKQDIIRKYIEYGELINNKDNSVTIKIYCYDGTVEQYIYRNKYKNQKLFNMDMTPYYTITDNLCEKGLITVRKGEKFLQGVLETYFI